LTGGHSCLARVHYVWNIAFLTRNFELYVFSICHSERSEESQLIALYRCRRND